MKFSIPVLTLFALTALMLTGCGSIQKPSASASLGPQRVRNEGYSLLYLLMKDESQVHDLLMIKHADAPLPDLIKKISQTATDAKKQLETFRDKDPQIILDITDLPDFEQQTRDAIRKTETHKLLFSSGRKFEVQLIFTQADAMNYGAHLADVLQKLDPDPPRNAFLTQLSQECTEYRDQLLEQLK